MMQRQNCVDSILNKMSSKNIKALQQFKTFYFFISGHNQFDRLFFISSSSWNWCLCNQFNGTNTIEMEAVKMLRIYNWKSRHVFVVFVWIWNGYIKLWTVSVSVTESSVQVSSVLNALQSDIDLEFYFCSLCGSIGNFGQQKHLMGIWMHENSQYDCTKSHCNAMFNIANISTHFRNTKWFFFLLHQVWKRKTPNGRES